MKKLLLIGLVLILYTYLFAVADMRLDLGLQNTNLALDMNLSQSNSKTQFTAVIDASFTATFDKGIGFYCSFEPDFVGGKFGLGAGFSYKLKLGNKADCFIQVGPTFAFGNSVTLIGADFMAFFDFLITNNMYVKLGAGTQFEFAQLSKGGNTSNVKLHVPLPSIALGWKF